MVNYITEYSCFIDAFDSSFFLYIQWKQINYGVINDLKGGHFIFDKLEIIYQSKSTYYIIFKILKHTFVVVIKKQKVIGNGYFLPKYQK